MSDVLATLVELGGAGATVVDLGAGEAPPLDGAGDVRIGVHRQGPLPAGPLEAFDILLSADPAAPRPWVGSGDLDGALAQLLVQIAAQPAAATVAAQVFRATLKLGFAEALTLESLGYSMLLASGGLRAWREANPPKLRAEGADSDVIAPAVPI